MRIFRSFLCAAVNSPISFNFRQPMEASTRASYCLLAAAPSRTSLGAQKYRPSPHLSSSSLKGSSWLLGPPLIDADCNFLHADMPPISTLLSHESTKQANIVGYLSPASTLDESDRMLETIESLEFPSSSQIKTTVGIHPYHASEAPSLENLASKITSMLSDPVLKRHISAVGETGLDYSHGFPPSLVQLPVFEEQVKIACTHNVPLFVHTRLAHNDTMNILRKAKAEHSFLPPVLIHCFTGTEAEGEEGQGDERKKKGSSVLTHPNLSSLVAVRDYLSLGFYIGVTGFINKNYGKEVRDILSRRIIPLDRLCIETDAPYMGFDGCRRTFIDSDPLLSAKTGKERKKLLKQQYPNLPSSLPLVLKGVTEALNSSLKSGEKAYSEDEVATATTSVSSKFFGFSRN